MSSSPGGSAIPGADAYATSKQCNLATVTLQRARTGLYSEQRPGGEANVFLPFLLYYILPLLAPFMKYWSNPTRAARVATKVLIDASGQTASTTSRLATNRKSCLMFFTSRENTASNRTQYPAGSAE
jgi:hypothetical protein